MSVVRIRTDRIDETPQVGEAGEEWSRDRVQPPPILVDSQTEKNEAEEADEKACPGSS